MENLLNDPTFWSTVGAFVLFLAERFAPPQWKFFNKAGKLAYELLVLHNRQQKRNDTLSKQADTLGLKNASKALLEFKEK